jgi:drug/metabolite transporter (DMT)-like permease
VGLLALLWGSNFLWIKIALDGLSPALLTFTRLATGALVLIALVGLRNEKLPDRSATGHLVVAALFANAAPYLLFAIGEQTVDSALAGILSATTPLWTVLIAVASRHERHIGRRKAIGIALGFGGVLLILQPWGSSGSAGGQLACLAAAASYGISYVYMSRYLAPRSLSPLALAAGQLVASSLWLVPALTTTTSSNINLTWSIAGALIALGPIGTGLAYVVNYDIINRDGATTASVVTYLLPVVSVVLGITVLNESIGITAYAGTAIVLASVGLVRR